MAFIPKVNFCLETDSEGNYQLVITDTTGVYDSVENPNGWEDASTILSSDVEDMSIEVTLINSDGVESNFITNVTSSLSDPVTGEFTLYTLLNTDLTITDGFIKINYIIETTSVTYKACIQKLIYPNVKCCISKVVEKFVNDTSNEDIQILLNKLKSLEFALIESAKTVDINSSLAMLKLLQNYCKSKIANCGCGC